MEVGCGIEEVGVVRMQTGPDPMTEEKENPEIIGVSGLVQKMIQRFSDLPSLSSSSSPSNHRLHSDVNVSHDVADVIRLRKEQPQPRDEPDWSSSNCLAQASSSVLLCSPNSAVRYTKHCTPLHSQPSSTPTPVIPGQPPLRMTSPRRSRLTQSSASRDDVIRRNGSVNTSDEGYLSRFQNFNTSIASDGQQNGARQSQSSVSTQENTGKILFNGNAAGGYNYVLPDERINNSRERNKLMNNIRGFSNGTVNTNNCLQNSESKKSCSSSGSDVKDNSIKREDVQLKTVNINVKHISDMINKQTKIPARAFDSSKYIIDASKFCDASDFQASEKDNYQTNARHETGSNKDKNVKQKSHVDSLLMKKVKTSGNEINSEKQSNINIVKTNGNMENGNKSSGDNCVNKSNNDCNSKVFTNSKNIHANNTVDHRSCNSSGIDSDFSSSSCENSCSSVFNSDINSSSSSPANISCNSVTASTPNQISFPSLGNTVPAVNCHNSQSNGKHIPSTNFSAIDAIPTETSIPVAINNNADGNGKVISQRYDYSTVAVSSIAEESDPVVVKTSGPLTSPHYVTGPGVVCEGGVYFPPAVAPTLVVEGLENINGSHTDFYPTRSSSTVQLRTSNSESPPTEAPPASKSEALLNSCPKDGRYFLGLLGEETRRLQSRCSMAEEFLNDENITEDARGKIRAAVGKATLLTTKKFQQFNELCNKNIGEKDKGDVDFRTTDEDLAGFWDLVSIQVVDVDRLLDEINSLRQSNWEENNVQIMQIVDSVDKASNPSLKQNSTIGMPAEGNGIITPQKSRSTTATTPARSAKTPGGRARVGAKSPGVKAAQEEARKRLMEAKLASRQRRAENPSADDDIQIFVS